MKIYKAVEERKGNGTGLYLYKHHDNFTDPLYICDLKFIEPVDESLYCRTCGSVFMNGLNQDYCPSCNYYSLEKLK